jgi:crossover junction endodeoxyribonuclease RuvC
MRILGIDPGSLATGFGVVERVENALVHVVHGTIRPPRGADLAQKLGIIHREIVRVIEEHRPDAAVIERVFVSANPNSAIVLGQARGAALAALGGAGLPVHELAAREIKKSVVGTGAATKVQVQSMVVELLKLGAKPQSDAADALAAAICQASVNRLVGLGVVGSKRRRGTGKRATSEAQYLTLARRSR